MLPKGRTYAVFPRTQTHFVIFNEHGVQPKCQSPDKAAVGEINVTETQFLKVTHHLGKGIELPHRDVLAGVLFSTSSKSGENNLKVHLQEEKSHCAIVLRNPIQQCFEENEINKGLLPGEVFDGQIRKHLVEFVPFDINDILKIILFILNICRRTERTDTNY